MLDINIYMEEREAQFIWKDLARELGLSTSGSTDDIKARVLSHIRTDLNTRCLADGGSAALRNLIKSLSLPMPGVKIPSQNGYEPGFSCLCGLVGAGTQVVCSRCKISQHRACMGKASQMKMYECPNCQLRQMEPFEQVLEVLIPATFCSTQGSPSEARTFQYNSDTHYRLSDPSNSKPRSIQIRCIRLDSQGFVQHWPKDCTIYINSKAIYTISQPPASSTRKRKDTQLKLSNFPPGSQNSIMVMKQKEEDVYAFGVFIVETLPVEEVLNRYLYEHILTPDLGKSFVRSRVSSSDDIQADVYRQPLVCPLTRVVPDIPARGYHCQHVQCFDLTAYVILQEKAKTNKWHCPICFGLVIRITVDEYMKEIVEKARKIRGCEAVEFTPDGGYRLMVEEMDADSDEEREDPGRKRPVDLDGEQLPVKRPKVEGRRLNWVDFKCLYQGLTPEDVSQTRCYQCAKDKEITKRQKCSIVEITKAPHTVIDLDV